MVLCKVRLLFLSLKFSWSWKIDKQGRLLVHLEIVISASISRLFLGPEVAACHSGYYIWGIEIVVIARNTRTCIDSIRDVALMLYVII